MAYSHPCVVLDVSSARGFDREKPQLIGEADAGNRRHASAVAEGTFTMSPPPAVGDIAVRHEAVHLRWLIDGGVGLVDGVAIRETAAVVGEPGVLAQSEDAAKRSAILSSKFKHRVNPCRVAGSC